MKESENPEKERLAELYGFNLLDTEPEREFDEIVALASLICETPISLITFVDLNRQWFKARIGIEMSETPRDVAFCTHAIKKESLMVVENATEDSRFSENPFVVGDPNIRFYAGMPLVTSSGHKLGTLCVMDRKPKKLTQSQQFSLQILARQVMKQMEFRKLNAKLKLTSERLRQATEGAQVGTFEYDLVKNTLICDDVLYSLYGVKKYTYVNAFETWRACIHPKDFETNNQRIQAAIRGEIKFDSEFRVIWPDGSIHFIKSKAEVLRDLDGKALRMLGANWDITEQKKNERELKLSNERDSIFVQQSPNAIAMFDTEMRYMAASQQWYKDYKLEGKDIIGRSHYEIFPEIDEDWKKIHSDCLKGNINKCEEFYFERAGGGSQWITWDVRPWYITESLIGGLLMYTADITLSKERDREKFRVEEILNKTNEIARIGTWEANLITGKVTWSRMTREIHGVDDDYVPLMGEGEAFFPEGENREKLKQAVKDAIESGKPFDLELQIINTSNRTLWVRSIGQAEFENNLCKRVYGIFQDIDESKRAKESIIEAKNLAEQSSLLKETFLANMSHEIRTPMNAIVGFTDLLLKKDLGEEEREYMQIVKNSGDNLLRIINDILDVSKINSGMMVFEEHPVKIPEIFSTLKTMLLHKAEEKGLYLNFESEPVLNKNVLADPTRLNQIILNLVGNALKFTSKGGVDVSAKILSEDPTHYLAQFSVKDTGIGIEESKLKYIFERFSQAEKHTTRNYGGTGLGLSIAKQLIELQGGSISIKSEPGLGSEFIFILPLKKPQASGQEISQEAKIDFEKLNSLKVLIVDDNPINIKLVLGMFAPYNIRADVAENGREAVEKVQKRVYDLVLMDIEMPEMSGYEATEIIRKELKSAVPIIAMSAHAMSQEKERSLSRGMNDYVPKPIKTELLFEKMVRLIPQKRNADLKKLVNLNSLKESMHGRKDIVLEILDLLIKGIPEDLEIIRQAIPKLDYHAIQRRAHRMKSTILTIGIEPIATILEEIESLSIAKSSIEKIKFLYAELEELCNAALAEVELEKQNL